MRSNLVCGGGVLLEISVRYRIPPGQHAVERGSGGG